MKKTRKKMLNVEIVNRNLNGLFKREKEENDIDLKENEIDLRAKKEEMSFLTANLQ